MARRTWTLASFCKKIQRALRSVKIVEIDSKCGEEKTEQKPRREKKFGQTNNNNGKLVSEESWNRILALYNSIPIRNIFLTP